MKLSLLGGVAACGFLLAACGDRAPVSSEPPPAATGVVAKGTPGFEPLIAFDSDRDGTRGIYLVRPDGSGLARLSPADAEESEPAFSPDGTKMAFVSGGSTPQIFVRDLLARTTKQLTFEQGGAREASFSPDGKQIVYVAGVGADVDAGVDQNAPASGTAIYVVGAGGDDRMRVWGNGQCYPQSPGFSADGNTIFFASCETLYAIGGSGARAVWGGPTSGTELPCVSPDGSKLAFASWASGDIAGESIFVVGTAPSSPVSIAATPPKPDGGAYASDGSSVPFYRKPSWGRTNFVAFEIAMPLAQTNIGIVAAPTGSGALAPVKSVTTGNHQDRNPTWTPTALPPR